MDELLARDQVDGARGAHVDEEGLKCPRFDPARRSQGKVLPDATRALATWLTQRERELGRRGRARTEEEERKFRMAVDALSVSLLASQLGGHDGCLEVPRQHALMSGHHSADVYGRHFPQLLDLLADPEVGLVCEEAKGFNVKGGPRQATIIRALPALWDHLPLQVTSWADLTQDLSATEVLILRGEKDKAGNAPSVAYAETDKTTRMRKRVHRLNETLRDGRVEVVGDVDGWRPDPTDRVVRRIFNNGSWTEGGRLFGGFWMTMPRAARFAMIRLDGSPAVNVDYEQLFPCLAYAEVQLEPPEGDLYDIDGRAEHRKGWKKLFNALLFARKPLQAWPSDTAHHFAGLSFKVARDLLCERHHPITSLFGSGIGYGLMHTESEMLLHVLEGLRRKDITALPLHDAVLVGQTHGEAAKAVMEDAAKRSAGISRAMVKVEKS